MLSNLGWLAGSLVLTLLPILGYRTRKGYEQYKNNGKKMMLILYGISSLLLVACSFICLKNDIVLAIIIFVFLFVVWLTFFSKNDFLKKLYNGIFEP